MRLWIFCAALPLVLVLTSTPLQEEEMVEKAMALLQEFKRTRVITPEFKDLLSKFSFVDNAASKDASVERLGTCTSCKVAVKVVLNLHASGASEEELKDMIEELCILLNIGDRAVCTGVIESNSEIFFDILNHNPDLREGRVCSLLLQADSCSPEHAIEWTLEAPLGEKPDPITKTPNENADILTIVHFTDIHYDPRYKTGGNAECNEPTCCRSNQGSPTSPSTSAGYWGDYRDCDMPWHAVLDALDQIRSQNEKIDYFYMTGDLVDHGVWETSRELNMGIFNQFYAAMREKFPSTPLFPSLGNHEPHPLNVYAPRSVEEELSTQWLYNVSYIHWRDVIKEDISSSVLMGGFYTTLAKPGLRIISLNNNICYIYNWWLLDSRGTELLSDQLNWLVQTLLAAEEAGEKVHILAHIPPGVSDTLNSCSREYRKIIDRFENTVVAQFNGHTHNDEIRISYSLNERDRATNIALNGGSGTPYSNLNPNYKVYKVDSDTGLVLDSETWIYNLTEANLKGDIRPSWYRLYSFREEYGVKALTPSELDNLAKRMANNSDLLEKYHRFYMKNSDQDRGCDSECLKHHLCQILTDHAPEADRCQSSHK